jgi:UDP-2,4-diacetamido-2,4,6-trideoxy-beta-L-altropyranose hydrolase
MTIDRRIIDRPLILRCDANLSIGTGHVMRCLALAQAWQDAGGHAVFTLGDSTLAVGERLRNQGFDVVQVVARAESDDAGEVADLADRIGSSWVVVDGYDFGAEYQARLKSRGLKVLFIDDNGHAKHYSADLVLNQNVHATEALYSSRETATRLLLGPRFAMLRREFAMWRDWKREMPVIVRKVLLTMGGSDPDNVTARALQVILAECGLQATVVAGCNNPQLHALRSVAEQHRATVRLVENATNMAELIASADIAVAGAGTTSLEMCFLGLPALLIVLAENQRAAAEELDRRGAAMQVAGGAKATPTALAECLASLLASSQKRKAMSETGRKLVDGLGAQRVAAKLNDAGAGAE